MDSLLQELQDSTVTTGLTIAYLQQVAQGMQYIHSKGFLHCNLSAACLYLDAYGTVKITDFSHARRDGAAEAEEEGSCMSGHSEELESEFSVRWMAPEIITDQKWSKAADVWYVLSLCSSCVCLHTVISYQMQLVQKRNP